VSCWGLNALIALSRTEIQPVESRQPLANARGEIGIVAGRLGAFIEQAALALGLCLGQRDRGVSHRSGGLTYAWKAEARQTA
jgi:hypothetical protein